MLPDQSRPLTGMNHVAGPRMTSLWCRVQKRGRFMMASGDALAGLFAACQVRLIR